ncbi:MAG: heme o synthase [Thermoguttaceae bacterium]
MTKKSMSIETTTAASSSPMSQRSLSALLLAFWQLSKPRIVAMVALTTVIGALVTAGQAMSPWTLLHAVLGSTAVVVGAIALNQRIEHLSDSRMPRTAGRPLPSGRLADHEVSWYAAVVTALGLIYLATTVNLSITLLTAISWLIYVWIYTPLKVFTAWQTPIGAIPGAMPALLGAAAAGSALSLNGLALFAVVYFWQFPHAMAIAWLYRRQFGEAGLKVASVTDPTGRTATTIAVVGAAVLLPISLLPLLGGGVSWGFALVSLATGIGYLASSIAFLREPTDRTSRNLLRASLIYLPVFSVAFLAAVLL